MAQPESTNHKQEDSIKFEEGLDSKQEYDPTISDQQEEVEEDAQAGVKTVEAITLSWNNTWLIITFACFWSIYCVNAFQSSITGNLSPYILSDFSQAPLVTVISTVSSALSAALLMPIARMLNVWDRGNGLIFMASIATLGLILSAACTNIYSYASAQVFYNVGFTGLIFCVDVFTIDTSTLRSRGLAYAFTSSPFIISAFAGPKAAEDFNNSNWRWAYGSFAIILPIVCLPLWSTIFYNKRKAKAKGFLQKQSNVKKTPLECIKWFVIEFDLAGVILLAGGLALFLLPFIIAGSAEDQWKSSHIIAMLVIGFCMLIGFAFFEAFFASKPFIPWRLLLSRTILGTCLLDLFYITANYCWSIYFSEYLQVVYNQSLANAGYIVNIFNVVNGVWLFIVGFLIRKTERFRWILWWSVPMYMLFEGLLIYFRRQGTGIGFIIMCQIFMAIAGGSIIICNQVAVLSICKHQDAASSLAILNLFGIIGGAIGSSVSGAIWTQLLPIYLVEYLPAESIDLWQDIYSSLDVQLSYAVGDPTRIAIAHAYESTQTWMLTAGTLCMLGAVVMMFIIPNVKLDKKQTKGVVF